MSVLAERCSADGPDGLHGVGEQGLLEVVVGGVGRVGAARGPGLDVYAHPGHIRPEAEPAGWRGLGRWGGSGKKLISEGSVRYPLGGSVLSKSVLRCGEES